MGKVRVYVDTSVIGGCLDSEFAEESRALLDMACRGEFVLLVSYLLLDELRRAPAAVKGILDSLPETHIEFLRPSAEAFRLRDRYLAEGIVGSGSSDDALHVALATTARADIIVSWNFKHIVHYDKIRMFNGVNLMQGYPTMEIRSPLEVV
jgi:predicted nucleic acid-binding protein